MVLIDVTEHNRFICQLRYEGNPFPTMVNGEVRSVYDSKAIEQFVYEKRPSLRGRDIRIEFSNQKV